MTQGKTLAIITARGGSTRIPRKNIRPFAGQPIIHYPIRACLAAGCFDTVMVSTEDAEIANIARQAGADVPFLRPAALAENHVNLTDVVADVLDQYRQQGQTFTYVASLMPCAPFLKPQTLAQAFRQLQDNPHTIDAVVPVVQFASPIQHAFTINDGYLAVRFPESADTHTQYLTPHYYDSAQFYFLRVSAFMQTGQLFMPQTAPLVIAEQEAQDIDTLDDWAMAELKFALLQAATAQPKTLV
jgi:pseudaminic acid cytidylyltransferase